MNRPFLSWQEWVAAGLVVVGPQALGWWALATAPAVLVLVMWGAHRRLSDPPAEHEQGHR